VKWCERRTRVWHGTAALFINKRHGNNKQACISGGISPSRYAQSLRRRQAWHDNVEAPSGHGERAQIVISNQRRITIGVSGEEGAIVIAILRVRLARTAGAWQIAAAFAASVQRGCLTSETLGVASRRASNTAVCFNSENNNNSMNSYRATAEGTVNVMASAWRAATWKRRRVQQRRQTW